MLMGSHRIHIDNTAADSLNVCISLCKKPLEPGIRQTYQSTKDVLTANKIVAKISRLETRNTQHLLHGCRETCTSQE